MRPLFLLLITASGLFEDCRSPGGSDKKGNDTTATKMDSAGPGSGSTSATSNSTNIDSDSVGLVKLKARFADAVIPFSGVWINEHYMNEIRERKPLHKSQDLDTKCIVIPGRTLTITRFIYSNHDGGASRVFVKDGSGYFTYTPYDGHCVDTIKIVDDGKMKIGKEYYFRVGEEDTTVYDFGILEQLLFAGQYLRLDDSTTAVFSKNGKIEGLDSLRWYEPVIDYTDDYQSPIDRIRLGKDRKHLNDYGLRLVGDTLMIYLIDCAKRGNDECALDTLGGRMYALRKL